MNRPEVALLRKRPETCYNRIEGEALPGGSNFRVRLDRAGGCGTEQGVEQAAISEVDLRGFDLPLADVLVPGGELPDHVGSGQQVEVALHGGVRNTERSREFGSIPNLPMVVSEHRPESPKRGPRQPEAQRRDVTLEVGPDQGVAPPQAVALGPRQERTREPAPVPELGRLHRADVLQGKALEL